MTQSTLEEYQRELLLIQLNPDYRKCEDCGCYYSYKKSVIYNMARGAITHLATYYCIRCDWGQHFAFRFQKCNHHEIEKQLKCIIETYAPIYNIDWDNITKKFRCYDNIHNTTVKKWT